LMLAEMMRPTRPDAEKTENVSVRNVPNARWRAYATLVKWVGWISLVLTAVCIISSAIVMALILFTQYLPGWTLGLVHGRVQLVVNLSIFTAFFLLLVSLVHKRGNAGVGKSPRHGVLRHFLFIGAFLVHLFVPLGVLAVICDQRFRDSLVMVEKIDSCLRGVLGSSLWVWPFLGVLSAMVRKLLVQYVGDVTVYVASTKIDKYDEVRKAIKSLAKQSALAVYSLKATAQQNGHTVEVEDFEYEKVAVVGHSLGSVISYDTLNRLLADDFLADKTHEIDDRTSVFLTFGSPLDKTAFFFSVMGRDTLHVREELASVVQPLIRDPKVRNKIPWVNVYSPSDIICGKLDFYDFPKNLQNEMTKESRDSVSKLPTVNIVENVLDNEAVVPLVAHVEYWQNEMVWNQLVAKLMGVPAI
jgi:hypothetical protein